MVDIGCELRFPISRENKPRISRRKARAARWIKNESAAWLHTRRRDESANQGSLCFLPSGCERPSRVNVRLTMAGRRAKEILPYLKLTHCPVLTKEQN